MSEEKKEEQKKSTDLVPVTIESGFPILKNTNDVVSLAKWLSGMQMAPKGFDSPQKVALGIMYAQSLGLHPVLALGQMFILNGVPTIYGDLPLSLVRKSGQLDFLKEEMIRDVSGAIIGARCVTRRTGYEENHETEFTIEDAKTAGLWGKTSREGKPSPWVLYPKRMLKMRARSENLKDQFGDVLQGIPIAEYDDFGEEKEVVYKNSAKTLKDELGVENG